VANRELLAFSAEQVRRLTGLSDHQLRYWDRTNFFRPQYADGSRAFGRIYSFRDVVGLRVIATLRKRKRFSLQELRKVRDKLAKLHDTPWASLRIYEFGKKVYFGDPESGRPTPLEPDDQYAFELALVEVVDEMRNAAARLRERAPEQIGQIAQNRFVLQNRPFVAGTRVPTEAIRSLDAAGYDTAAIIREYPRLTNDDVRQALAFERDRAKRSKRRAI
jgi:DNA-binding transcriptional MerR regulator